MPGLLCFDEGDFMLCGRLIFASCRLPTRCPNIRVTLILALVAYFLPVAARAAEPRPTFDLEVVANQAEKLAKEPYHDPKAQVPDWLLKITYDQWRDIRFRPEHALWHDQHLPFQVQFFH